METINTTTATYAGHMLYNLTNAQLGMCDRALTMAHKATTEQRRHQFLTRLHNLGGFLSRYTTIDELIESVADAIADTEIKAFVAAEYGYEAFAKEQFHTIEDIEGFIFQGLPTYLEEITKFHRSMDALQAEWETEEDTNER